MRSVDDLYFKLHVILFTLTTW